MDAETTIGKDQLWTSVDGSVLPYGRQTITEADIEAVVTVLRSDWLTQGPVVAAFEKKVADHCGVKHAVAVSSGTAALHIGAQALGLEPGDLLWTTPNTFVASANCARYCGAEVDFVDIDSRTYNLCTDKLADKLKKSSKKNRLPKVVVPVDFAGQSCDMEAVASLAKKYDFAIMQDAAHAIGARYQGRPAGDCRYSDLSIFSFHPVKIITTGEGGILTTNCDDLYKRLLRLRTHGITRNPDHMEREPHGPWCYEQIELGFNYRMTDIQAALGISQMNRLDECVANRRELAAYYDELLADLPLILPWQHPDTNSSWHLYVIRLQTDQINKTHREIFEALRAEGIGVQVHYIPVHLQPYYRRLGFKDDDFPESEKHLREAISLPLFSGLDSKDQRKVVAILRRILNY